MINFSGEGEGRWTWNKDQSVLTMETILEGVDKGTDEKYFTTRIDVYSKSESSVLIESYVLTRKESSEGKVTVSPNHESAVRELLQ